MATIIGYVVQVTVGNLTFFAPDTIPTATRGLCHLTKFDIYRFGE